MSGPRNKLWHAETIDTCGHESSIFLLAKTEREAREKLTKMGELGGKYGCEIVNLDTCLACAFAEVRGEDGRIGTMKQSWKGVRFKDSVKATGMAEEMALHFGHNCHDCTEDSDETNCEMAYIEEKLNELLAFVASDETASALLKRLRTVERLIL